MQITATDRGTSLLVDQVRGELYWVNGNTLYRNDLDGNGLTTVRTGAAGQAVYYLTIDALARQLYWLDLLNQTLMRRSLLDGSEATLISGLANVTATAMRPPPWRLSSTMTHGSLPLTLAMMMETVCPTPWSSPSLCMRS